MTAGTVCFGDGSFFWFGRDKTGAGIFRSNGYQPVRISTPTIEAYLKNALLGVYGYDYQDCRAYLYEEDRHLFYCLNIAAPSAIPIAGVASSYSTPTTTWVYDVTTGVWHERQSLLGGAQVRHFAHMFAPSAGRGNLFSDFGNSSGNIYNLRNEYLTENGTAITRTRIGPPFRTGNKYDFFSRFILDCEVGTEASGTQNLTLSWSDDGGQTWPMSVPLQVGSGGNYRARAIWRRLGKGRDRRFKITTSDAMNIAFLAAYLEMEVGRS